MVMVRTEKDSLGTKKVPLSAYYGIFTQRALENFRISELRMPKEFIDSFAQLKMSAAQANMKTKTLDKKVGAAIVKAAKDVVSGMFDEDFDLDVYQAGAGTPFNMNVNEVIANRANVILGSTKGKYKYCHPNDHVNLGQSSNDSTPTVIRLTTLRLLQDLEFELKELKKSFKKKETQFSKILKSGRTHMQDAVPVTLGQEFGAYATAIQKNIDRLQDSTIRLRKLGIGGSAVGTGINSHPQFKKLVVTFLKKNTGLKLENATNLLETTQNMTDIVEVSNALTILAIDLNKISNDLILLSSGPKTGFNEIGLPAIQPGSSIMPGKVNPSMCEALNMICFQVIGLNQAIQRCATSGQLELNWSTPLIGFDLFHSLQILTNGVSSFNDLTVKGIKANKDVCKKYFEESASIITLVAPIIGYDEAAKIVKQSLNEGKTCKDLILEKKILTEKELSKVLSVKNATSPNLKFIKKMKK